MSDTMLIRQALFNSAWSSAAGENAIITIPASGSSDSLVVGPGAVGILIRGHITLTTGAGSTGVDLKLRQGSNLSGPVIGETISVRGITAGSLITLPVDWVDTITRSWLPLIGTEYVVTGTQSGAPTAAAVTNSFFLAAENFSGILEAS